MNAGRLRSIPTHYPVQAPVRFVTLDGREFVIDHWHADGPQPAEDGKPVGMPSLVFVLREVEPQT